MSKTLKEILHSRTFYALAIYALVLRAESDLQWIPDSIAAAAFIILVINCAQKRHHVP